MKLSLIGFTVMLLLFVQTQAAYGTESTDPGPEKTETVYERVIAHGGGAYNGYETTNSTEALNHAIASGYKIIELDMELSSDNKIIMLHDWDRTAMHYYGTTFSKKLSQRQFMNLSVYGKLEVLTFDKLAETLKKYPDIRIVTDTKGDNQELLTFIAQNHPDLVDRFIPQIYDFEQLDKAKELGYEDIIFTLYAIADPDAQKVADFAKDHELYAVTMPDYMADRGLCKALAGKGIVVYVHPVSNYETALQYMAQGAYGVYSGSLLPEEFSGIEKEYYLTETGAGGSEVKLTDDRIDDWKELKLHGQKPGDTVLYEIDQSRVSLADVAIAELPPGKHLLTISVLNGNGIKGSIPYLLWKDSNQLRILHKKYEYRLNDSGQEKDFPLIMKEAAVSQEVVEMLEHSLIAKEGEHAFYFNGIQENYMNGEEMLPVQKGSFGKLMLPLGTTLRKLGAASVTMDGGKDITIVYGQEKTLIMANSVIARKGFLRPVRLKHPVVLYLNKAMAAGEFYQYITGRNYIEMDGIMILLPSGVKPDSGTEKKMLEAAGKLFR